MKVKLSFKIFTIVAAMVILSSITVCVISILTFKSKFAEEVDSNVKIAGHGGEVLMQNWEQTLAAESKTIAGLNRTTNGLANNDLPVLQGVVQGQVGSMDADYLLIADRSGDVLAGSVGVGKNISDIQAYQNVMRGDATWKSPSVSPGGSVAASAGGLPRSSYS